LRATIEARKAESASKKAAEEQAARDNYAQKVASFRSLSFKVSEQSSKVPKFEVFFGLDSNTTSQNKKKMR
jgi:hypothetical protein